MKKNNIPDKTKSAPVKTENHIARNNRKEAAARSRARRIRSMLKKGMKKEQIDEIFAQEGNRMVLVLVNGSFHIQDGTRTKTIRKRDGGHKLISVEKEEVPNILHGVAAAKKYADDNKLSVMATSANAIWILSDKNHVDNAVEKLKVLGRVSVTKPEKKAEKKIRSVKKPTNNTEEVKKAAKAARKAANMNKAEMRAYYAALRKGGVNTRIKKYNKTLADKIEAWLKERRKAEAEKAERVDKHKRDHRQISSTEMKANRRARKAAKRLAVKERRIAAEKAHMENNAGERAKRPKKAQKPIQTELKMAA